jgi:hypothetical protein
MSLLGPRYLLSFRISPPGSPNTQTIYPLIPAGEQLRIEEFGLSYDSAIAGSIFVDLIQQGVSQPDEELIFAGVGLHSSPYLSFPQFVTPKLTYDSSLALRTEGTVGPSISYMIGWIRNA